VVIVNYNGGDDTLACLDSVLASDWPAEDLEVVLVDNASADGVAAKVKAGMPRVSVVESGRNRGFAGGCNLALQGLDGVDYVALLNNDTTVEPGWLRPLVEALDSDPGVGAASPKILFRGSFVDVEVASPTGVRGRGDGRELGVRLSGARLDGRDALGRLQLVEGFWGPEHGTGGGEESFQWTSGAARLRVPVRPDGCLPRCELRLAADSDRVVTLRSGANSVDHVVGPVAGWVTVPLGGTPHSVVNNVGSLLVADGYGADRGYQAPDGDGRFGQPEEVFAWCGAAVLLSREYLESVGLFDESYFLYYEDFDLSWRGRAQGWRYMYVPGSVVHHVHSASSVEGSRLFAHYVERNRLLTLTRNAPLGFAARAALRYALITGSYARRDIVSPLAHARRPSFETVGRRLRSLGGYGRHLPAALAGRRRLRRRRTVGDPELLGWMAEG
jgi:GT2 family glycosyltransferase